eukprot:403331237
MKGQKFTNVQNFYTNSRNQSFTASGSQQGQKPIISKLGSSKTQQSTNLNRTSLPINTYQYKKPTQSRNILSQSLSLNHANSHKVQVVEQSPLSKKENSQLFQNQTIIQQCFTEEKLLQEGERKASYKSLKDLTQKTDYKGIKIFGIDIGGSISCGGDVLSSSDLSATTTVSKSISKFDIANLENKIKQLESQITNIKDKHVAFSQQIKKSFDYKERKLTSDFENLKAIKEFDFSIVDENPYQQPQNHRLSTLSAPVDLLNVKSRNSVKFNFEPNQTQNQLQETFHKLNQVNQIAEFECDQQTNSIKIFKSIPSNLRA